MPPDAMAESSPAPVESAEPTPQAAPAPEPTPATPQDQPPFHLHPRFRELTAQNRELKAAVQQMQTKLQQIEQARSAATPGSDEAQQLTAAAAALKRIFAADPELKALFEARTLIPNLARGYQSLSEAQKSSQRESARTYVTGLAKEAGLPTDPKWTNHLVRLVAGQAMSLPDGDARFESGDFGVLKEAFESVKQDFISTLNAAGAATTATAKGKTAKLPPAPRGGAAGEPPPPTVEPGKERAFTRDLHKRGLALLQEKLTG